MSTAANPRSNHWRWGLSVADANTPTFTDNEGGGGAQDTTIEIKQADLDSTVFFLYIGLDNDGEMNAAGDHQLTMNIDGAGAVDVTGQGVIGSVIQSDLSIDSVTESIVRLFCLYNDRPSNRILAK